MSPPVNLAGELIGPRKFVSVAPLCPGQGAYTLGGNKVPALGTLYMTCSLDTTDGHVPDEFATW